MYQIFILTHKLLIWHGPTSSIAFIMLASFRLLDFFGTRFGPLPQPLLSPSIFHFPNVGWTSFKHETNFFIWNPWSLSSLTRAGVNPSGIFPGFLRAVSAPYQNTAPTGVTPDQSGNLHKC